MLDEQWNWKINVDYSGLENGARMAEQRMQQQAMASAAQVQANYSILNSAPLVGDMSGRGMMAQQTYQQALYRSGLTSFYNTPLISSRPEVAANYSQPEGLLEGPPLMTEFSNNRNLISAGRQAFTHKAMQALRSAGEATGLSDLGVYGAGDYTQRLIRSQQIAAEKMSTARAGILPNVSDTAMDAIQMLSLPASFLLPGGFAAHMAGEAALMAFGAGYDATAGQRDAYKNAGLYFKDAFAGNFKDRIGGGASYQRAANFVREFQKKIAKDEFLKRDEYTSILEMGASNGLFQTMDDEKKMLKGIENIASAIKAFNAIGSKLKDTTRDIGLMSNLGLNVAEETSRVGKFVGTLGLTAFNANTTQEKMMERATQAGTMMSHQGVDAAVGAQMYMQNAAMTGMMVRGGGISHRDLQKMGGAEGFADRSFQGIAGLQATGIGDFMNMAVLRDPTIADKIIAGNFQTSDLNKAMMGMTPQQYYNLQYKKSSFSTETDEAVAQYGTLYMLMKDFQQKKGGGKISEGELKVFLEAQGIDSGNANAIVKSIVGSPAANKLLKEEQFSQGLGVMMEANRGAAKPWTNWTKWWENNSQDKVFGALGASWAGNILEKQGNIYDERMKELTKNYVTLRSNVNSFESIRDRETAPDREVREAAVRGRLEAADRVELRQLIRDNQVTRNLFDGYSRDFNEQKRGILDVIGDGKGSEKADGELIRILRKLGSGELLSEDELRYAKSNGTGVSLKSKVVGDVANATSKEAENKTIENLRNTKEVRTRIVQGLRSDGSSEGYGKAVENFMSRSLGERNAIRDVVSGYASSKDFEGLTMYLARQHLNLPSTEFNKKYRSLEDLKGLSKEDQEAIGLLGNVYSQNISNKGERDNFTSFVEDADKNNISGIRSLDEVKKIRDASSYATGKFNKSIKNFLGLTGFDVSTKTQVDIVSGAYKEQLIEDMLSTGDYTNLRLVATPEDYEKYKSLSGAERDKFAQSILKSAQQTVGSSMKELIKANKQHGVLYAASSAKAGSQIEGDKRRWTASGTSKADFLNSADAAAKALLEESFANAALQDSTVDVINNLIGGESDRGLRDSLRDSLAKLKGGKFTADYLFSDMSKASNANLSALGEAGKAFLSLKGKTGDELETAKLIIKSPFKNLANNPQNAEIFNKLLEDMSSGSVDVNEAATQFLNYYQGDAGAQSSTYGAIGTNLSGGMLTVDQQKSIQSAYEVQEKIAGLFGQMEKMVEKLPSSYKDMLPEEATAYFGIAKRVSEKMERYLTDNSEGGGIPVVVKNVGIKGYEPPVDTTK